jgi:predicted transcriptional regulator
MKESINMLMFKAPARILMSSTPEGLQLIDICKKSSVGYMHARNIIKSFIESKIYAEMYDQKGKKLLVLTEKGKKLVSYLNAMNDTL